MGSSKGVGVDNVVTVCVDFFEPKRIDEALRSLYWLHMFFELCLGRRQRFLWIEVELERDNSQPDEHPTPRSVIFWNCCNEGITGLTEPTHYNDVLLQMDRKKEFDTVLSRWLDSMPTMVHARERFGSGFLSRRYTIDRIVGAANMFDLLPDSHLPMRQELSDETIEAVEEGRKWFKALPDSSARQFMLSALGRVGSASLREKVCHRASMISALDSEFSELHIPCSQAILCRNHYVHGSSAAFDYAREVTSYVFLTDTLEFVFAISDLIDLGWNCQSWIGNDTTGSHPFGLYLAGYHENLRRLKVLITD